MGSVVDVVMDVDSTKLLNDEAPAEALGLDKLEVILPKKVWEEVQRSAQCHEFQILNMIKLNGQACGQR